MSCARNIPSRSGWGLFKVGILSAAVEAVVVFGPGCVYSAVQEVSIPPTQVVEKNTAGGIDPAVHVSAPLAVSLPAHRGTRVSQFSVRETSVVGGDLWMSATYLVSGWRGSTGYDQSRLRAIIRVDLDDSVAEVVARDLPLVESPLGNTFAVDSDHLYLKLPDGRIRLIDRKSGANRDYEIASFRTGLEMSGSVRAVGGRGYYLEPSGVIEIDPARDSPTDLSPPPPGPWMSLFAEASEDTLAMELHQAGDNGLLLSCSRRSEAGASRMMLFRWEEDRRRWLKLRETALTTLQPFARRNELLWYSPVLIDDHTIVRSGLEGNRQALEAAHDTRHYGLPSLTGTRWKSESSEPTAAGLRLVDWDGRDMAVLEIMFHAVYVEKWNNLNGMRMWLYDEDRASPAKLPVVLGDPNADRGSRAEPPVFDYLTPGKLYLTPSAVILHDLRSGVWILERATVHEVAERHRILTNKSQRRSRRPYPFITMLSAKYLPFDTNGDDRLDRSEWDAYRQQQQNLPAQRPTKPAAAKIVTGPSLLLGPIRLLLLKPLQFRIAGGMVVFATLAAVGGFAAKRSRLTALLAAAGIALWLFVGRVLEGTREWFL